MTGDAFVLFATLFAVNAAPLELEKRETQFTPCPDFPPDAVGLDIKMTPDPVVLGAVETFDIKGTMKKDIIAGDWLVTCPITAGTVFSTTQEYTAPDELPAKYTIAVAIGRG
ncbi:hypothetical protein GLOIN_2v1614005 [Rhizophagus irregularis DAOM 181602=DAOM 197198]|nr:hypothetical protein RhiirB3_432478 [Rhizophagus irregularis]GBC21798.2 hypothetical protein GLOIN_2v1614005 [Rhizophagus irregularis DAOM 181602=DAOM 197198]